MTDPKYTVGDTAPKIEAFLRNIIDHAGFELGFEIADGSHVYEDFETPDLIVRFSGVDVDLLLENRAELMLAMELLTQEMLGMPGEHHSRVVFDANDYRLLRIEELRMSAMAAAERVKKTRVPYQFNPMNSRERRIIHLALREETTLRSESLGQGPMRHVVILPADMPSLPEPPPSAMRPSRPYGDRPSGGRPPGGAGRGGPRDGRGGFGGGRGGDRRGGPGGGGGGRPPRRGGDRGPSRGNH